MKCRVEYTEAARNDLKELGSPRDKAVRKVIDKVAENPLPKSEGGYGNPLGNKRGKNLTGLCKIKLLKLGIRVVYKVIRTDKVMRIIVIAARADDEVYNTAAKRNK
ncbi:MAG: type II toxin-antitoxin system RelE/ParE family toxin [Defluviitaleaceae bacterium]|nr:type II toxin-antitoxin system RelE/ParE family toxin [Defluviitaleaceae bacterium]